VRCRRVRPPLDCSTGAALEIPTRAHLPLEKFLETSPGAADFSAAPPWIGPDVDPFILHLFAALAQKERAMIASRTNDALAAARARGVVLGGPNDEQGPSSRPRTCCP
jgi:hypothetical protein